jgi:hypothetical protein
VMGKRPRKTWMKAVKDDMRRGALSPEDPKDRGLRRRIHGAERVTWVNLDIPLVLFHL